jgi:hypothetical protein
MLWIYDPGLVTQTRKVPCAAGVLARIYKQLYMTALTTVSDRIIMGPLRNSSPRFERETMYQLTTVRAPVTAASALQLSTRYMMTRTDGSLPLTH